MSMTAIWIMPLYLTNCSQLTALIMELNYIWVDKNRIERVKKKASPLMKCHSFNWKDVLEILTYYFLAN